MSSRFFNVNRHNIGIITNIFVYVLPSSFAVNFISGKISYNDSGNNGIKKANDKSEITSTDTNNVIKVTDNFVGKDVNDHDQVNVYSNYYDEPYVYDLKYHQDKSKCSFCSNFLNSPCRVQFQRWSKCVDAAKKNGNDYTEVCREYTKTLINCTGKYTEYFNNTNPYFNDDDDEDYDDVDDELVENEKSFETSETLLETAQVIDLTTATTTTVAATSNTKNNVAINKQAGK